MAYADEPKINELKGIAGRLRAISGNIEKQGIFEDICGLTPELANYVLEFASGTPLSDFISLTTSREAELAKIAKAIHSACGAIGAIVDADEI